tara:strand:- start:18 stop:812 length:795 start_codon:yes stop_codon:yes gene_type:complete
MQAPKILPVIDETNVKAKPHHPHLPDLGVGVPGGGSLLLLLSPVRTGKSTIISNLLLNESCYGQYFLDDVQIISNTIANCHTSRFLRKAFNCHDHYDDKIIDGIVNRQKSFAKIDQPQIALILDDCLGSIKRESKINHLASRYRHFSIKLLIISSQKFRGSVSPIIRANATDVIIGSPFPNQKELEAIAEEFGDNFGGKDNFLKHYHLCTPNKYDFCYLSLQDNPPLMYHNFSEVRLVGGQKREIMEESNTQLHYSNNMDKEDS